MSRAILVYVFPENLERKKAENAEFAGELAQKK